MVTALLLAVSAGLLYGAAALSSSISSAQDMRSADLTRARIKYNQGSELSESEAQLLLEDELMEQRNNRFRHF